jgi:enoyl-CoA hydratase/carnithine racemase
LEIEMVEEQKDGALLVERPEDHIVVLTFNQPERLNALSAELMSRLVQIWPEIDADPTVRVVVLTGAGRGFCSGADMAARPGGDGVVPENPQLPRFTARQAKIYKPVITAVNGVCAGAGLHFVADADIVIASDKATFTDSHVNVGQVTALEPIGLSRKMPLGLVTRMVCVGRHERMTAERACEVGMVSEVLPGEKLMERAMELARFTAAASPATLQISLKAIWESLEFGLTDAYNNGYAPLVAHWTHPDAAEGPAAFMEKREPNWAE